MSSFDRDSPAASGPPASCFPGSTTERCSAIASRSLESRPQLTRNLATSASAWWLPTTGEFGPRGGFGDYEDHKRVALRLGSSYTHSHENRFAQITSASPDNAQIRLSDGVLLFQTGALAEGVTINDATYQLNAFDAGAKYRGAFLQTEIYMRRLNRFAADGPLPNADIYDSGWYLTGSYMVVKKKLELYGVTSQVYGQFNRSTEGGGGLSNTQRTEAAARQETVRVG